MVERVIATEEALTVIKELKASHGALVFHLSGGCCDGTAPMCYEQGEFKEGSVDVLLGTLDEDIPFYMHESLYEYMKHTQIIVDVTNGMGGFSLEAELGKAFLTRSRPFTEDEEKELAEIH